MSEDLSKIFTSLKACAYYSFKDLQTIAKDLGISTNVTTKIQLCKLIVDYFKNNNQENKIEKQVRDQSINKEEDKVKKQVEDQSIDKEEDKSKKQVKDKFKKQVEDQSIDKEEYKEVDEKEEENKLEKQVEEQYDEKEDDNILSKCMKLKGKKLLDHQKRVVEYLLTHRGIIAVHSTGTGKTLLAVAAINCIKNKYENIKVIVITPLGLRSNFINEMKERGIEDKNVEFYTYKSFLSKQKTDPINCKNTFLIVDEAHNLRAKITVRLKQDKENPIIDKGGLSYSIIECAKKVKKVLLLTATPLINRGSDIQNLLLTIEGIGVDGLLSENQFEKSIVMNEKEFLRRMRCKTSFYTYDPRIESSTFPTRVDIPIIKFVMSDSYYKRYSKLEQEEMEAKVRRMSMKKKEEDEDSFFVKLRMAVNSLDQEKSPKINWVIDFVLKEQEEGRKTIIFSNWMESGMYLIRKRLDELDEKNLYGFISGDLESEDRDKYKELYNNNKIKILLISRAGGEGLNFKGTNNVIILESNWNKATDEQIIGRAIRYDSHSHLEPGESREVKIYRLMMIKPEYAMEEDKLKSIDEELYNLAYNKKAPILEKLLSLMQQVSIEEVYCEDIDTSSDSSSDSDSDDEEIRKRLERIKVSKKNKIDMSQPERIVKRVEYIRPESVEGKVEMNSLPEEMIKVSKVEVVPVVRKKKKFTLVDDFGKVI